MKKLLFGLIALFVMTSCSTQIIPRAVNTVNSVSISELNLERKDYQILKTVSADATILYSASLDGKDYTIKCPDENFALKFIKKRQRNGGGWSCEYKGIVKLGYLANDYKYDGIALSPEEVARRLAIYRLINQAKLAGADGLIEPIISTNIDNGEKGMGRNIVFKTSVCAKLIKLKTDK